MPHFTTKEYRLDKGEQFTQPDSSLCRLHGPLRFRALGRENGPEGRFILSPAGADAVTAAEADTVLLSTTV